MTKQVYISRRKWIIRVLTIMAISLIILAAAPAQAAKIVGTIYYNNRPIADYSTAYAEIELRNVDTNEWLRTNYAYDNEKGTFTIENVPPGKYSPSITIQSGYPFDLGNDSASNAGDFISYISGLNDDIVVPPHLDEIQNDLKVVYSIHLLRPVDNEKLRTYAGDPPEKLYQSFYYPSADTFEWEPVPGASGCNVRILLKDGETGSTTSYYDEYVDGTQCSPNLEINSGNDYYMFTIEVHNSNGELIATFDNFYKNGFGGWFEFQIIPHP